MRGGKADLGGSGPRVPVMSGGRLGNRAYRAAKDPAAGAFGRGVFRGCAFHCHNRCCERHGEHP